MSNLTPPPLYTEAGLKARLAPAVFTLLDLHSCHCYWVDKRVSVMRIRPTAPLAATNAYVDIAECHWDNIPAWQDAVDLCCEEHRRRNK